MSQPGNERTFRTITLEEHFATSEFMAGPGRGLGERVKSAHDLPPTGPINTRLVDQLLDLDDLRISEMDAAGIDVQVLSLNSPGVEQLDALAAQTLARQTNDSLGEAVQRHPDRFAGFAALPTALPDIAAGELERTVRDYGFKGAVINGHNRGRYLDDPFFGLFSNEQKLLRFQSICTQPHLRSRSSRPLMSETLRLKYPPS
jgi:predicted TIM-barrel fold metal-dependent hydrolase